MYESKDSDSEAHLPCIICQYVQSGSFSSWLDVILMLLESPRFIFCPYRNHLLILER